MPATIQRRDHYCLGTPHFHNIVRRGIIPRQYIIKLKQAFSNNGSSNNCLFDRILIKYGSKQNITPCTAMIKSIAIIATQYIYTNIHEFIIKTSFKPHTKSINEPYYKQRWAVM